MYVFLEVLCPCHKARSYNSSDGVCDPQKSTDLTDNIIVKRSPTGHYQKSILLHLNPRKIFITTSNCKALIPFESSQLSPSDYILHCILNQKLAVCLITKVYMVPL